MLSRTLKVISFILCHAHFQNPRLVFFHETHQLNFAIHKTKHHYEYKKSRGRKHHEANIFSLSMHSASKWIISDAGSIPEGESCWILLHLSRAQNMTRKSMACIMLATQNRQWIQIFGSGHEIILSLLSSLDCGFIILTLRSLDKTCSVSSRCISLGVVSYMSSE